MDSLFSMRTPMQTGEGETADSGLSPLHGGSKGAFELDGDCCSCGSNSTRAPQSPDKTSISSRSLCSQTSPPGSGQLHIKSQPLDAAPESVSIGSLAHAVGECKPCAWFWKPEGCKHREKCTRCHLCPPGEIKLRKKAKLILLRSQTSTESLGDDTSFVKESREGPRLDDVQEQGPRMQIEPPELFTDRTPRLLASPPGLSPVGAGEFSLGSANHGTGLCTPCAWFWKPQGCSHGSKCTRCHLCPEGELKARKQAKVASLKVAASDAKESIEAAMPQVPSLGSIMLSFASPMTPPPPKPPVLASLGSLSHGDGQCRPCSQVWKAGGCAAGRSCADCHLCPEGEAKMLLQAKLAGICLRAEKLATKHADVPSVAMFASTDHGGSTASGTASLASTPRSLLPAIAPWESRNSVPFALSIGSMLHNCGNCSPCAWFWKPQGCQNGVDCGRCHLCPPGEVKNRKKAKLQVLRQVALPWPYSLDAAAVLESLQLMSTS